MKGEGKSGKRRESWLEHIRRTGNSSANVPVESSTEAHQNQDAFLKNDHNKKQLIAILSHHLRDMGHDVRNSDSDADTLTVSTALEYALNENVTVITDDTDILVLLMYHWHTTMKEIYFHSQGNRSKMQKHGILENL